ncbi:uncharacterized protein LOC144657642 [Oculina patagonica]
MPFRVTPKEAILHEDHKMPSSISLQSKMNEVSMGNDSIPEQDNVNEQLLKEIDDIYSPVLKLMKLFGIYFGDTSLTQLTQGTGRCSKRVYLQRMYCGVVVSGFWLNFVMSFANIIFGDNIYVFIMITLWCLLIALCGTICLLVLCTPSADTAKSRFKYFIRGVLAVNSNVNFVKVKSKSRKGLVCCCFFVMVAIVGVLLSDILLGLNIYSSMPWNQWVGFMVISRVFFAIGCGVWFLPILFFFITCLILEEVFNELHKRMSSLPSIAIDMASLKMEYHKLCEVVELADKMLAPLLLGMVSVYIPLICFNFYQAVSLPQEEKLMSLMTSLFWLLAGASIFATLLLFGSNVSEKIQGFQKTYVQTFPVSKEEEGKLLMFILLDLQGDPKGLSIGGLAVITKSMSLTIVGVIVSYFTVMLSLPK